MDGENTGIQRLLPRHHFLLRLVLSGQYSFKQMAEMMDYTEAGIRNIVQSPLFQNELARRRASLEKAENHVVVDGLKTARNHLNRIALGAVEEMETVMATASDPKLRLDAADKILKYAFPKDAGSGPGTQVNILIAGDKLARLQNALSEAGAVGMGNAPPPAGCDNGEVVGSFVDGAGDSVG